MSIKIKLPDWFNGELYEKGAVIKNRFTSEKFELNNIELSMYDFIMGMSILIESGYNLNEKLLTQHHEGLIWFRKNNIEAYMVLLD